MSNKLIGYDNQLWRVEQEFSYTGNDQPFTLEPGTYLFICEGAHSGKGSRDIKEYGGITYGEITLNEATTFHAVVGSDGADYNIDYTLCTGGFNGGAHGGMSTSSTFLNGPGGGGATDIRLLPYDANEYPSYNDDGTLVSPVNSMTVSECYHIDDPDDRFENDGVMYQKCEYIIDSGSSYFDTGVLIQSGTCYAETKFMFTQLSSSEQNIFGTFGGASIGSYSLGMQDYKIRTVVHCGGSTYPKAEINATTNTEYIVSMKLNETQQELTVNGTTVTQSQSNALQNTSTIHVCANGVEHIWCLVGRLYYLKIYDNDTLVLDLIPCIRLTDNIAGMFDLVTNRFFKSDTSTNFSAAETQIHPSDYTALEYIYAIGSTNSGYFNTGYIPKANTKIETEVVCYENTIQSYEIIFGARNGSYQNNAFVFFSRFNNSNIPVYNRSGAETQGVDFLYNEKIKLICYRDKAEWFFNDSETPNGSVTATGIVNDCICPLLINTSNNATSNAVSSEGSWNKFKLYSFKISEIDTATGDETVIKNYVPAYRNADHKEGLFDIINNTFITPNSGAWLQGPPKTNHPSLNSRIMVAAGAGGHIVANDTGVAAGDGFSYGGGPYGSMCRDVGGVDGFSMIFPTQSDGYAFGYGCYPTKRTTTNAYSAEGCGGGGGGWYSGYASIPHNQNASGITKEGGGGSSYVLTASSYKPSDYHPEPKYYFTKALLHGAQAMGDLFSNNPEDWTNGHVYICKKETNIKTGDIIVYPCTGDAVSHDLPAGKYKLKVWGGDGGSRGSISHAVKGGYSEGIIDTQNNHTIYVYTGGSGGPRADIGYSDAFANTMTIANLPSLKFNGGKSIQNCARIISSSGGGTDIRFDVDDFYHRVIVAGGAGSEGMNGSVAGEGGGTEGGTQSNANCGTNNGPGTQKSGYAFGIGGPGYCQSGGYGGCGGGGWYGGYGTTPDRNGDDDRAGSGGSGFTLTANTPITDIPSGYACNEEEYYLTEATTVQGGNALPIWHTKTQIEVISITAKCICRDADGYKYYDKENEIWTLLENQSITSETFETYGSIITTDNGLLNEYYVYAYDANEQTNAISLNVIPNSQTIRIQLDVDIPVSEIILDDAYEKESFHVYYNAIRVKQEDDTYKTALEIYVDHLLNDDNVYKAYVCQIYGSPRKTSNTYIKLDSKGRRIFQHKYFDIDTGELVTEERTMEWKDPEDYRGEDGIIQTAQWLLPVGSAYNIPYDYNMNVVDHDIINIYNGVVAEHDRIIFFALACRIQTVNAETGAVSTSYQLIIKAMNLIDQTVYSICRIPWRTVYTIHDDMFIGKMLVDDKYFYLCMQANNNSSVAYERSLVRIHRNDFSVSMSSTSGEALVGYGHMEWYDETHILIQGLTQYLLYDTVRNTWSKTPHLINGTSISTVQDWALGKTQIVSTYVRSNNKSIAICDRETFQLIKIITLPHAETTPRVCYDGNGKFYIATQYYLYEYDEETSEITNTINLSIMPYPNTVTYCNGAVIVTQYSNDNNENERRLIVYRTDIDQYTSIYMPWGVGYSQQYDYCYIPLAIQGKFFYVKNSTLILDYSKYAKYKFGPHRNRHTVVLNKSNDDMFTYDSRFVSVMENCIKVHDGNIEYSFNEYDTNHITRTNQISKEDYRYLLGSTVITNEEGDSIE